jgi:TRAP-type C4-dicarboxylate transport system substrate-binding protein
MERINKLTGGRLEVTYYPADELVSSPDILDALRAGTIEMAMTVGGYYKEVVPEGALVPDMLPPLLFQGWRDQRQLYEVYGLQDIIRDGFLKEGAYLLDVNGADTVGFWAKDPIYGMDELQGLKIRSFGNLAIILEKLGAAPAYIPHSEGYTALATGVVDAYQTGYPHFRSRKYYELCKYIHYPPWINPSSHQFFISLDVWNELPDDIKYAIEVASDSVGPRYYLEYHWYESMDDMFDDWGVTKVVWGAEDLNKVAEVSATMLPEIAEMGGRNAEAVDLIMQFARDRGYLK